MSALPETPPAVEAAVALRALDTAETVERMSPGSAMVAEARAFVVHDAETYAEALRRAADLRVKRAGVEALFADPKAKAHAAHKSICIAENRTLGPFDEGITLYTGNARDFHAAEERRMEQERRRLEAEAKRVEETRRLEEAASAVEQGMSEEEVLATLDAPVMAAVEMAPAVPKIDGVSYVTTYRACEKDKLAALRHVVEHPEWLGLVTFSPAGMNRLAASQREGFKFPGFELVKTQDIRQRAR